MTLTKEDLKDSIRDHLNVSKKDASSLVESVLGTIKNTLESGEDVTISGFGKFSVRSKNERPGRNFQTDEEIMIEPRKVVRFKCSEKLRERMNGK